MTNSSLATFGNATSEQTSGMSSPCVDAAWMRPVTGLMILVCLLILPSVTYASAFQDSKESKPTEAEKAQAAKNNTPWHYRPYDVTVWVVADDKVRWTENVLQGISEKIQSELLLAEPSAWKIQVGPVPEKWRSAILHAKTDVTTEVGEPLYNELSGLDKLFIVRLKDIGSSFQIETNEIDISVWSNGPIFSTPTFHPSAIAKEAASQITNAFRPIVRIDDRKDRAVSCTIRAYGLLRRTSVDQHGRLFLAPAKQSPCWVQDDEVFEPILRQIDRKTKKYLLKDIREMDFTLLVKQPKKESDDKDETSELENSSETEEAGDDEKETDALVLEDRSFRESRLNCEIVSAKRPSASLGRRYGRGVQRFGLVVRNPPADTTVRLITRRGKSLTELREVPLSGYEIYSRPIDKKGKSVFVGKTDWRGEIVIKPEPGQERVRVLLVKSGSRRLARLPLMPGYKPERQITLPDDEDRLRAEGVISGLQSEFLDLFARRGVLRARLELELKKEEPDFDNIEKYYKEFMSLRKINKWDEHVSAHAERLSSYDPRQSNRIKKMFKSIRDLSKEHLSSADDEKVNELYTQAIDQHKK